MLKWQVEHIGLAGPSIKLNAECIIHATLEDDKATVKTLYSYGYRLGPDTDQHINKVQVCMKLLNKKQTTPLLPQRK